MTSKKSTSSYCRYFLKNLFFCLLMSIVNGAIYYQTEFSIESDVSQEDIKNNIVSYFFDNHDIVVLYANITMNSL